MSNHPGRSDADLVAHALLIVILAIVTAAALFVMVPALFNQHSTVGDLAALATVLIVPAADYLAVRHVWRSWRAISDGGDA